MNGAINAHQKPRKMVIAIDGPAAAGKGTLAKRIAAHFDFKYLDTGSLYRGVGLKVVQMGGDPNNEDDALAAAQQLEFDDLDGDELRTAQAGENASIVAQMPSVRKEMLGFQRRFAQAAKISKGGCVLDGRDIGTVVCPDAEIKLFVTASAQVRAQRRHDELLGRNEQSNYETVLADLKLRDKRDTERRVAPLVPAQDAHLLDTSKLDIETAFQTAIDIINSH